MNPILLFIAILPLLFFQNENRKVVKKSASKSSQIALKQDSVFRFTVSFISIGSGVDKKAKQDFNRFVDQFNSKNGVAIKSQLISWGREGESDYCFRLSELDKPLQEKFIIETKEILKASSRIRYFENEVCKHRRR